MNRPRLSIVIPALNEAAHLSELLQDLTRLMRDSGPADIIVVDAGSRDGTREIALASDARVIASIPSRGAQLDAGVRASRAPMLWFLHADSRVTREAWDALQSLLELPVWGRFDVQLGSAPGTLALRSIARAMNLRSRLTCIATGDQGLFVSRCLLEQIGGVPRQPLMEDIELSARLRRISPPRCLGQVLQTSARRWQARGVVRATLQMFAFRAAYALGVSPESLARKYYAARSASRA